MVSMASIAASLASAKSRGTLLSTAISRLGFFSGSIDQIESCLHQFLALGICKLVHQWAVLAHNHSTLALEFTFGLAALHDCKLPCHSRFVNEPAPRGY